MANVLEQKGVVDIEQVPKDFNPRKIVYCTNVMNKVWDGYVDGKKYHFKQNESKMLTEPEAHLLAKQIANYVVFGEEEKKRQEIRTEKGEDAYIEACRHDVGIHKSRFEKVYKQCLMRPPKEKDVHLSDPVEQRV